GQEADFFGPRGGQRADAPYTGHGTACRRVACRMVACRRLNMPFEALGVGSRQQCVQGRRAGGIQQDRHACDAADYLPRAWITLSVISTRGLTVTASCTMRS